MNRTAAIIRGAVPLLLAVSLVLGGCAGLLPRSQYSRPEVAIPDNWQQSGISLGDGDKRQQGGNSLSDRGQRLQGENSLGDGDKRQQSTTGKSIANAEKWWRELNDPELNRLIEQALRTNNDLAAAAIKVRRAQLTARLTDINRTPSVSVSANSGINRQLNHDTTSYSSGITGTASYELDLWGKLASARDVSRFEAEATEADRQSVALALIGTTANDYWQIAYLNERIATSEASIAYAERVLELVNVKYAAGAVASLDLVQARQTVASQRAELTQLLRQRTEARNALAILFDQPPGNSIKEPQRLPDGPLPEVQAGLPASLLAQRPDLRAAEQRLRKYLASVDNTRASYYPSFTLTAAMGSSSTTLLEVLKNPFVSLGAGLTLPFIQMNTMKLNVEIAKTDYQEAVVNFRQALYSAFADVENALSGRMRYAEEGKLLEESLALAEKAERLAEVRYRSGWTALQAWLDAQESRRSAEKSLADNRLSRLKNLMTLYQALGGSPAGINRDSNRGESR